MITKDRKKYMRNWRKTNRLYVNKKQREYYRNNPSQARKASLRRFNLNECNYEIMLIMQEGVCAICKKGEIVKNKKHLSVDHCHKTGKIRGLLCGKCNMVLGLVNEDVQRLKNIIIYLKENGDV